MPRRSTRLAPITRSVEDAALLLEVMAGPDSMDSTASQREVPAYSQQLTPAPHYRIGYIAGLPWTGRA